MDFSLDIQADGTRGITADLSFDKETSIFNNIFFSLMIDKGSFFHDPKFGSRLYLLQRSKNIMGTERLAKDYCAEALQWMIDCGKAVSFEIITQVEKLTASDRLKIHVLARPSNGGEVEFFTFKEIV